MGNCCEPTSSTGWDGEDWSDLTTSKKTRSNKVFDETLAHGKVQKKEKLMGPLRASPDANGKATDVRISKKELAELLEKQQVHVNNKKQVGRASSEQVLLRLIKARRHHDSRHGFWRPDLESIPEPASSMEWDGEDWSDLTSKKTRSSKVFEEAHTHGHGHWLNLGKVQKEKLMEALRVSPNANGKVKIKISKKELAELLEKQQHVNKKQVGRASAEQPASSMEWDGEDWSDLTSKKTTSSKVFDEGHTHGHGLSLGKVQKEKLMGALGASPDANGKVKIKISKQQQVNKKQVGRASAEQVLLRLINARDHDTRHRLWRPVLESIPELG
ncbi:hypothetical protein GmHk_07G020786 [Glycine max]|nr:hypothetical protein GmHk_07G020786 [Glycine max]